MKDRNYLCKFPATRTGRKCGGWVMELICRSVSSRITVVYGIGNDGMCVEQVT
jgi:hypothetical protein